jgi:glutaredoxin-related protein
MYGYRACPDCGVAVQRAQLDQDLHRCVPERFVTHQALKARPALERLEEDMASWLTTPQGAVQAFLARRIQTA